MLARDRLRKLKEYISRAPSCSRDRLAITRAGLVKPKLKNAYSEGTSLLPFTLGESIEKLSAVIPPTKFPT